MSPFKAVIFDLDGVLLDEKEYVLAAYRSIARFLSGYCALQEEELFNKLVEYLDKKGSMYPRLFNDIVSELGLDESLVTEILRIYSSVDAPLKLRSGAFEVLEGLKKRGIMLCLVTNGLVETQRNKVRLFRLDTLFELIVYAREMGKELEKPHPASYLAILEKLCLKPQDVLAVGDNPYTDFVGAKKLGIYTSRLLSGEFKNTFLSDDYEADCSLKELSEIFMLV